MAADELGGQAGEDVGHGELARLFGQLGMEQHLEEEVAQLFRQTGGVRGVEDGQHLVGFLDEVGAQALVGLLPVPGAAVRRPQAGDDGAQLLVLRLLLVAEHGYLPRLPAAKIVGQDG